MRIFVGNLAFEATEADLQKLFSDFGSVSLVRIMMERKEDKSRGFGFVEMDDEAQAGAAITALNGKDFFSRPLNVEQARVKPETPQQPRQSSSRRDLKPGQGFEKRGRYKKERFPRSFRRESHPFGAVGQSSPERKSRENYENRNEKPEQSKPWQKKTEGASRPWRKPEGGSSRPYRSADRDSKPWRKTEGESRPWRKPEGGSRPYRSADKDFKPWKKTEGEAKPWRKPEGASRPFRRTSGDSKPWKKSEGVAKSWGQKNKRPQKTWSKRPRKSAAK